MKLTRVILLLAATTVAATPAASPAQTHDRAALYSAALSLRATDLDGRTWDHDRLKGRVMLVDFWATWCAPCLRELPYLREARSRFGERFEILGISLDTFGRGELRNWLGRHDVGWPQVRARKGYADPLAVRFGVDRLPTNLLLDRLGRLRAVDVRREQLLEQVERLLAEPR